MTVPISAIDAQMDARWRAWQARGAAADVRRDRIAGWVAVAMALALAVALGLQLAPS